MSGLLTLYLGLDDALLLHERILPEIFGINEHFLYVIYAGTVFLYIFKFYPIILKTDYVLMVIALSFFALSLIIDITHPFTRNGRFFFEDGSKFIGLVSWFLYFYRVGKYAVYPCSFNNDVASDS